VIAVRHNYHQQSKQPRVSVIIPAYNAAHHICRAVESALSQTYPCHEVIVVDDGSTDQTRERLAGYGDCICYLYQEHRERSAARNAAINRARGEFLAFLDADDYWAPARLERQVALMDKYPDLGLVFSWAAAFEPGGKILRILGSDFPVDGAQGMHAFEMLALRTSPPTVTVLARTSCIREVGLFDEQLPPLEDWDLWLRVALHSRIGYVPEILAYRRLSEGFQPARLDALRAQEKYPRVIKKVFNHARSLSLRREFLRLEPKALRRAYFTAALIDYAVGNVDSACLNMEEAYRYESTYFEGDCIELVRVLVDFALNLYDTWTPPSAATAFLETFFENLPNTLCNLHLLRRSAFRMLAAGHGFRAWTQQESVKARTLLLKALFRYPELARNVGIWSICWRSLWGNSRGLDGAHS
jgi:glycosyltransferase involved in cell wall biosynthesis